MLARTAGPLPKVLEAVRPLEMHCTDFPLSDTSSAGLLDP